MYYLVIHTTYESMYCRVTKSGLEVWGYFQSVSETEFRTYQQVSRKENILFTIPLEVIDG